MTPFPASRRLRASDCSVENHEGRRIHGPLRAYLLARQDVSQQQVEELTAALTEVLASGGGKVTKNEYWGLKGLSYRIRKNRKAHYTLLNIEAAPQAVAEMERQMRINEDILRFMTVRVDELEEGPSAMMQKRDRDDRDGGRPGGDRGGFGGERRPRRF